MNDTQPLVLAYGVGRDSTAILVGWHLRGIRPDYITFADTGVEKPQTYEYIPVIRAWLKEVGFPDMTTVRYEPKTAPYDTLEGNCCMNCTLPSETFNLGACSQKFKQEPQNKWARHHPDFRHVFKSEDLKITKAIGYEADEENRKNKMEKAKVNLLAKENAKLAKKNARKHSLSKDKHFDYQYPLIDWGWTLEECIARIKEAGLPVPVKSSCWCCANMKPDEVRALPPEILGRVMRMEILAEPYNQKIYGIWRKDRKRDGRPGSFTEFILQEGLPYVHPDDLPDEMPRNPACGKAKPGYTFHPPHRDVSLQVLVDQHQASINNPQDIFDLVEHEIHADIVDSI